MTATEKILIADQDGSVRHAMSQILTAAGYITETAETGSSALFSIESGSIDLVILDPMLSGSSGLDVCHAIRQSRLTSDLPVLFVSSRSDVATYTAAIKAGGNDFLTKPLHRGELLLRVRSLLQLHRMQKELALSNALLTKQRDALVRLQAQKDDLLEIIVHDLKNPLAAIASNARFMSDNTEANEEIRQCSRDVSIAAQNMLRMVHNVLDLTRDENARLSIHPVRINLVALAERTCALMAYRAEERRITLSTRLDTSDPNLEADEDLLRRLIENLLDNAIRYSRTKTFVHLTVCDDAEDGWIVLSIADSGPGVPSGSEARIFEKYAQLDRSTDRAQQRFGRGLGLPFVKRVVEAHGGTVAVSNIEPNGACFKVRLPRTPLLPPIRSTETDP